jgi:hypothetical protein
MLHVSRYTQNGSAREKKPQESGITQLREWAGGDCGHDVAKQGGCLSPQWTVACENIGPEFPGLLVLIRSWEVGGLIQIFRFSNVTRKWRTK